MSSWIPQTYSNEAEAVVSLVNALVRASYTYLSLSFFFDLHNVAPEGLGHFFFPHKTAEEQQEGVTSLFKCKSACSCSLPFQILLKPSQDEWGETQHTVEVPCSENNLKHPCDRTSQVLPLQTPTSVTAGRATP